MDTLATSIEIDQPPSRVYAFLTDDENLPLWATDVLKVERLHGDNGEVGSISKRHYTLNGTKRQLVEEITEIDDNRLISGIMRDDYVDITHKSELNEIGENKTALTMTVQYKPKSAWGKVLYFFNKQKMHDTHRKDLLNLKSAIETLA